jgi:hypothetical protein
MHQALTRHAAGCDRTIPAFAATTSHVGALAKSPWAVASSVQADPARDDLPKQPLRRGSPHMAPAITEPNQKSAAVAQLVEHLIRNDKNRTKLILVER